MLKDLAKDKDYPSFSIHMATRVLLEGMRLGLFIHPVCINNEAEEAISQTADFPTCRRTLPTVKLFKLEAITYYF